ncbi:MAG: heavy-metal-associated domain-containing protein [Gammaproteobacteria bacterium]
MAYTIENMTCGGCVRHVTRAVQAVAPEAKVEADLPSHMVRIETSADEAAIRRALADAGYPPN